MEIRTLRYFMAIAREENMTRAAETLHVTQPALSRQMQALEAELGKKLFRRHSFSIELTEEGMLLRRRAEDLLSMADKITLEFSAMDDIIGGNIYFGCAESFQIRHLARAIRRFKMKYPDFHYHITSGDTEQVTEKLDKGLLDFAVIVEEPDYEKYFVLQMPEGDRWGLIMPDNCALAQNSRSGWKICAGCRFSAQSRAGTPTCRAGAAAIWTGCIWKVRSAWHTMARFSPARGWGIC